MDTRVVIAMSGGVDSSVAAAILVEQGHEVIGMMLRLWSEPGKEADNRCCTPDAMAQARRVAAKLGIPFYVIDAQELFKKTVVQSFMDGYLAGITPNPCIECNRRVRWEFLLNQAFMVGAKYLATGHYARLDRDSQQRFQLRRAADPNKDQSYVLHGLTQEKLRHTLFPLGDYTKPQVRRMAQERGLSVANRPESQDLCFLSGEDYRAFLLRHAPQSLQSGPILTGDGLQIGTHQGLAFYTIGQRKGLGLSAPQPLYVLQKDVPRNALIVGSEKELGRWELVVARLNWITGEPPAEYFHAQVKIRYKTHEAPAEVFLLPDGRAHLTFEYPLRGITPGQSAVLYHEDICIGGGLIQP